MLSNCVENNVNVVSFASPRVGNYAWKKSFKGEVSGGVLIPPAAMSALIAFSEDTGETEKAE